MHLILAFLILGLSIYRLIRYNKKIKKYYKVKATIVGLDQKKVDDAMMGPKYYFAPILAFTDKYGQQQEIISGEDNPDRPLYKTGTDVTILVNPNDSSRFIMYSVVEGYVIPILWILVAFAIIAIPLIFPKTFAE
ncbi:MAG: hypothetical protein JWQ96_2262 [Segetibacter sp.]|nr:hypothetical protein [Segetibacter sp.]